MTLQNKIRQFYYKKSRIQQYKGFCYTVRLGTIKKAGESLGVSASAVTMQIKALESDLKMKLFVRTPNHRLIPTEEGAALYNKLIPIVQNLDGVLEEFLKDIKNREAQHIKIAAHHTAISSILPVCIKKHLSEFPNTVLDIDNIPKKMAVEKLKNGELDVVFYPFDENEKIPVELMFSTVFEFKLVIIAHKKHPISKIRSEKVSINEMKNFKFFHISNYMVSDMYKSFINKYNNKVNINLTKGNWETAKNIVKANICASSVGDFYLNEEDREDITVKYCPELFPRFYYAILTKKGKYMNPSMENFLKVVKNYKL